MVLIFNVLLLCALATALVVPAQPLDLNKRCPQGVLATDISRDDDWTYHIEVKVGSQGKLFRPNLDTTGAAWFPNDDDWTQLSTLFSKAGKNFGVKFYDGPRELGDWVRDTVAVDDKTDTVEFGLIPNPLQKKQGSFTVGRSFKDLPSIPVQLKNHSVIDHGVASVYYRADKHQGKLILGGYDQAKVDGDWSVHSQIQEYKVPITNVTVDGDTRYPEYGDYPIAVGPGGKLALPQAIVDPIAGLYHNPQPVDTRYQVDCDVPDGLFQLGVGNLIVDFQLKDFVEQPGDGDQCYLAVDVAERNGNITRLSGVVLDKLVTVFDYDNDVVKVAHFKDTDDEDIVHP